MLKKIIWILLFILLISFHPEIAYSTTNKIYQDKSRENIINNWPIAVVGDLQKTSVWEYMIVREQNDFERGKIIDEIKGEEPKAVIILGDMIYDGSSRKSWTEFDLLLSPIINAGIKVFPIVGNHEYWGNNYTALSNLHKRFPELKNSHWYSVVNDSIAFIFLDTNKDDLTDNEWENEKEWFEKKLKSYDADSAIKGVIVCAHHPPYTNSIITGDEIHVQLAFLPAFFESEKTLAFLTGHAHTYERFIKDKKTFIVSGGGGGPRVTLKTGKEFHNDLYTGPSPRPFNYLLLDKESDGLRITVKGIEKGGTEFFIMEEFVLPFSHLFSYQTELNHHE